MRRPPADIVPGKRPGAWTTEFWIAAGALALCVLGFFLGDSPEVAIGGAVVSSVGYNLARAWVKVARVRVDL